MAERSSLNQVVQIAVESVPGTEITTGFKKMQAISIEPSISSEVDVFRPMGNKFASFASLGKEWTESDISGRASYNELIYMFSSVLTQTTPTTPVGGTVTREWKFTPTTSSDDTAKTYTVQHGSSVRGDKFTYGLVTELGLTFNRDAVEVSGSMLGRRITDGITLSTSVSTIALSPVLPTEISVYLNTSGATIGTTKLTRVSSVEWSIGSRFGPVWVLDAAENGYVAHVETEPDLTLNMTLEADSNGMALLDTLRDGSTRFIRIEAIGTTIESTLKYKMLVDVAVKLSDTGGFSDEDGVYSVEWNFTGVNDATWGKATEVTMWNTLTAL